MRVISGVDVSQGYLCVPLCDGRTSLVGVVNSGSFHVLDYSFAETKD